MISAEQENIEILQNQLKQQIISIIENPDNFIKEAAFEDQDVTDAPSKVTVTIIVN